MLTVSIVAAALAALGAGAYLLSRRAGATPPPELAQDNASQPPAADEAPPKPLGSPSEAPSSRVAARPLDVLAQLSPLGAEVRHHLDPTTGAVSFEVCGPAIAVFDLQLAIDANGSRRFVLVARGDGS